MRSMNVSLPDAMRAWIQTRIESGQYASVSDYVRDLIRHDQIARAQEDQHAELQKGIDDLRAGRVKPAEEVLARLEQKFRGE